MMAVSAFLFAPFGISPAHGIAVGVTVAGFLEILWLSWFLRREGVFVRPHFNIGRLVRDPETKHCFAASLPGCSAPGVYQINMFVDTVLVSLVGTGAISWLYYANRMQQLPLGVVGAAIGVALRLFFPASSKPATMKKPPHTGQSRRIRHPAFAARGSHAGYPRRADY